MNMTLLAQDMAIYMRTMSVTKNATAFGLEYKNCLYIVALRDRFIISV